MGRDLVDDAAGKNCVDKTVCNSEKAKLSG